MINEDVKDTIERLVSKIGKKDNQRFLTDLLNSITRISTLEGLNTGDWKLLNQALKEFQASFKTFAPYRKTRKVCLFGSARLEESHPEFKLAESFSKQMADNNFMIITGAGGGIMAAGNKGASSDMSFGEYSAAF